MKRMLVAIALVSLVACGEDDGGRASASDSEGSAQPVTISFRALDFGFAFDKDTYPAGSIELVMTNEGGQPHQALLYKLNDGIDPGEFKSAAMKDQSMVPRLAEGGMDGIRQAAGPGENASAGAYVVDPGIYVAICWLPDQSLKTEKNHAELGMIQSFVVE